MKAQMPFITFVGNQQFREQPSQNEFEFQLLKWTKSGSLTKKEAGKGMSTSYIFKIIVIKLIKIRTSNQQQVQKTHDKYSKII